MDDVLVPAAAALEEASRQLAVRDSIAASALATANGEILALRTLVAALRAQLEAPAGYTALICDNTGSVDVTTAFQAALTAGAVYVPAGVYLTDPLRTLMVTHSLKFHADALVTASANAATRYCVMKVVGDDVDLAGVRMRGDRLSHTDTIGASEEWCSGLLVTGSRCSIDGLMVSEFPGDGIGVKADDTVIRNSVSTKNGRNGLSVYASRGFRAYDSQFTYTGALGTSPAAPAGPCAGVDFEPDNGQVVDARMERCTMSFNRVGCEAWTRVEVPGSIDLTLVDCTIERNANGVLGKGLGGPVRIVALRNTMTKNTGSAFRAEHGATITAGDGTLANCNVITGMAARAAARIGQFSGIVTQYDFLATGPSPAAPGIVKAGYNDYR